MRMCVPEGVYRNCSEKRNRAVDGMPFNIHKFSYEIPKIAIDGKYAYAQGAIAIDCQNAWMDCHMPARI